MIDQLAPKRAKANLGRSHEAGQERHWPASSEFASLLESAHRLGQQVSRRQLDESNHEQLTCAMQNMFLLAPPLAPSWTSPTRPQWRHTSTSCRYKEAASLRFASRRPLHTSCLVLLNNSHFVLFHCLLLGSKYYLSNASSCRLLLCSSCRLMYAFVKIPPPTHTTSLCACSQAIKRAIMMQWNSPIQVNYAN